MTYTALFIAISPILVALLRKDDWPSGRVAAVAVGMALIAYIGGRYLDGVVPSLQLGYLQGFAAAVVGQQTLHRLIEGTEWFGRLEDVGNTVPVPEMPLPGDA